MDDTGASGWQLFSPPGSYGGHGYHQPRAHPYSRDQRLTPRSHLRGKALSPGEKLLMPDVLLQRRWWIVGLLLLATILNYVDRQSLSILATTIQQVFGMSDYAYGHVVFAFLLSYTVAYAFSGPFCDRFGVRVSMALLMTWWS